MDLVVALIERSSDLAVPESRPENGSFYLRTDDATRFSEFRDAVDGAIAGAEPADWLVRDLKEFERMIAEFAIEDLQSTPEGLATLDAIRAIAVERLWTERLAGRGEPMKTISPEI